MLTTSFKSICSQENIPHKTENILKRFITCNFFTIAEDVSDEFWREEMTRCISFSEL